MAAHAAGRALAGRCQPAAKLYPWPPLQPWCTGSYCAVKRITTAATNSPTCSHDQQAITCALHVSTRAISCIGDDMQSFQGSSSVLGWHLQDVPLLHGCKWLTCPNQSGG